jgi:hypothetical protein
MNHSAPGGAEKKTTFLGHFAVIATVIAGLRVFAVPIARKTCAFNA